MRFPPRRQHYSRFCGLISWRRQRAIRILRASPLLNSLLGRMTERARPAIAEVLLPLPFPKRKRDSLSGNVAKPAHGLAGRKRPVRFQVWRDSRARFGLRVAGAKGGTPLWRPKAQERSFWFQPDERKTPHVVSYNLRIGTSTRLTSALSSQPALAQSPRERSAC